MRLLSIDPGVTCSGFAEWEGGSLLRCGLLRTEEETVEKRAQFFFWEIQLLIAPDQMVIEKPEVYQQRFWKGDPRDLVDLAIIVGAFLGAYSNSQNRMVYPKEWKGQVPKDVSQQRTLAKLTEAERKILKAPQVFGKPSTAPRSLLHNMMDAVGIGLWILRR